jgi:hypothetical protein
MKQDPPTVRKIWNGKTILLICGIAAILLVVGSYWRYGASWKIAPQPDLVAAFAITLIDQEISIPKIPGGASGMFPQADASFTAKSNFGMTAASGWTPIRNDSDPGQLLMDITRLFLARKVERYGTFQYIPPPHTIDANRNKPVLYEVIQDAFKCSDGTAVKLRLTVYYEDGTQQEYYPWGYAGELGIWKTAKLGTALSREMSVVCAVELTSESTTPEKLGVNRILGAWQVGDGAQGRIGAGPIVISDTQIAWTTEDNQQCTSGYDFASRSTASTYPGAPMAESEPGVPYSTFVLKLKGPHLKPCAKDMSSFTISLTSNQNDFAHFSAFFVSVQGSGVMRRVSASSELR